jgi:hypothetical protein
MLRNEALTEKLLTARKVSKAVGDPLREGRLLAIDADADRTDPSATRGIPIEDLRNDKRWREETQLASERVNSLRRRKIELKHQHWETWIAVKQAVDGADPEGFLAMGCPNDEYDHAVVYLTGRVLGHDRVSRDSLATWFLDRYGLEPDLEALQQVIDALEGIR